MCNYITNCIISDFRLAFAKTRDLRILYIVRASSQLTFPVCVCVCSFFVNRQRIYRFTGDLLVRDLARCRLESSIRVYILFFSPVFYIDFNIRPALYEKLLAGDRFSLSLA